MAVRRVRAKITDYQALKSGQQCYHYETSAFKPGFFWCEPMSSWLNKGEVVTLVTNAEGKPIRVLRNGKDLGVEMRLDSTQIVP